MISHLEKLDELNLIITDLKVIKIHGWRNHQFVPKPQDSVIPEPKMQSKGISRVTAKDQASIDTVSLQ